MVTVAQCRKILGRRYEKCTDMEIQMIREWLYKLAEIELFTKATKNEDSNFIHTGKH